MKRTTTPVIKSVELPNRVRLPYAEQGDDNREVNVSRGIAGFSKDAVREALEQNLWELWSHFGRGPGCALHDEGAALWFDTPIPVLHSTPMARSLYEKVGFRPVAPFRVFAPPQALHL